MSSDEDFEGYESQEGEEVENSRERDLINSLGQDVAKKLIYAHSLRIQSKKNDLIPDKPNRKHWAPVKAKATQILQHTFGYTIKEDMDGQVFLCDANPKANTSDHIPDEQRAKKMFLFIVLGYLTLSGRPVTESQVLEFLRKLGIESGHAIFGNVHDLLTKELPSQSYLRRIKEESTRSEDVVFRYDWGTRSIAEVDKEELLNKFSAILGKPVRSFVQMDLDGHVQVS